MNILLVDDHEMLRDAVTVALSKLGPDCRIHGFGTGTESLLWLEHNPQPDLVLLDVQLPDGSGISFLQTLRQRYPTLKVAMLSGNDDAATIQQAMHAGAVGFVTKAIAADTLVATVTDLLKGLNCITTAKPGWTPLVVTPASTEERFGLTKAQARVLRLLVKGMSNRQIADQLTIAEGTVKAHTSALFRALNVDSRAQLIVRAQKEGF